MLFGRLKVMLVLLTEVIRKFHIPDCVTGRCRS
jgi:hypothetical protein